ncbi:hypothetical protein KC19_VG078900 [Ceratodon purpureus]|uniref:Uncharacterized protein n=1 Tax=Ceratodon purpureus TaxID=3225 RepID=A0A8T0HNB0_CERPU|nr:hypothetical protein KC19_VG078900 [Ceratodon purpureus]
MVCALVVMFSAISLYNGSFFGNWINKSVVEETFDPTASGWAANLAACIRGESGRGREVVGDDVKAVKDEVEEEVEEKEKVAGEKDAFAEKLEGNDDVLMKARPRTERRNRFLVIVLVPSLHMSLICPSEPDS